MERKIRVLIADSDKEFRTSLAETLRAAEGIEVTAEVRLTEMSTAFVNRIAALAGVRSAVLVSYNGDYLA